MPMPEPPAETPFARWLDSVVPALYPDDSALARACDVSPSTVFRWRRGNIPKLPALLKLAAATRTSTDTLLRVAGYQPDGGTE